MCLLKLDLALTCGARGGRVVGSEGVGLGGDVRAQ